MPKENLPHFSRRELARTSLLGGVSCALASKTLLAEEPASGKGFIDVRQFGAKGDGKNNDSQAIQRAIDGVAGEHGAVFLPPGEYLTSEIQMRPGTALVGIPSWNYRESGGSVIKLASGDSKCLINITGAWAQRSKESAWTGGVLARTCTGSSSTSLITEIGRMHSALSNVRWLASVGMV